MNFRMYKPFVAGLAIAIAAAAFFAASAQAATPSDKPSFDCARASAIELIICDDSDLSAADRRLSTFYALAKPGALGSRLI